MNFQPQIIFSHEQLVQWAKETSDNPGTTVYDDAITSANSIRDREERDMIVDTLSRSDAIIKLTGVIIQSKLNMKSVEEQLEIKTSLTRGGGKKKKYKRKKSKRKKSKRKKSKRKKSKRKK